MAFGPIMKMQVGELHIELAPLTRESTVEFIADGGMQQHGITRYLARRAAPTLEDELEWYDRVRNDKSSLTWGIWVVGNDGFKTLIGNSSLNHIGGDHFKTATSGSIVFRREYWGKGIAKHTHRARTWYGFTQLGLTMIRSAVVQGNVASLKALLGCGYVIVSTRRNFVFVDGQFRHENELECVNPNSPFWDMWWGKDEIPTAFVKARQDTRDMMEWAEVHVRLP